MYLFDSERRVPLELLSDGLQSCRTLVGGVKINDEVAVAALLVIASIGNAVIQNCCLKHPHF